MVALKSNSKQCNIIQLQIEYQEKLTKQINRHSDLS